MRALALPEFSGIALYPVLAIFVAELEYPLKVDAARRVKGPPEREVLRRTNVCAAEPEGCDSYRSARCCVVSLGACEEACACTRVGR
jgi:hypothetical protein